MRNASNTSNKAPAEVGLGMAQTESIDRLFLELSQFTNAKTERELYWMNRHDALYDVLQKIADTAHDNSTGPAVPDVLWEIRNMAHSLL